MTDPNIRIYMYICLDTGVFREIVDKAERLTVNERIDLLEKNEKLASIHEKAGKEGQTDVCLFFSYLLLLL